MSITETAMTFFDAIETGKDWDTYKDSCHDGATFSCQADTLAEINNLKDYALWMKGMLGPVPDLRPEIKASSTDEKNNSVSVFAVVHGTQTGEGGPVPPTGNKVAAEYVYVIDFDGDKIKHMTKVWNDGYTLKQLGWV